MFKKIFKRNDNSTDKYDIDYLDLLLISTTLYIIVKAIKKHDIKIKDLQHDIEELKSKGE